MEGFLRCAVQSIESEVEEGAIGFSGAGVGGCEDELKERTNPKTVEDWSKAVVEVGDHRERRKFGCGFQEVDGLWVEQPSIGLREVVVEGVEEVFEAPLVVRSESSLGECLRFPAEIIENLGDQASPPRSFGGVTEWVQRVVGIRSCGEDALEGGVHLGGIDRDSGGRFQVPGVGLADLFSGMDQGVGGVKEERQGGRGSIRCGLIGKGRRTALDAP